jgi:hypothetical protein
VRANGRKDEWVKALGQRRFLVPTSVAVAAAMGLAACGGGPTASGSARPLNPIATAFDATTAVGSANVALSLDENVTVGGADQKIAITGTGAADFGTDQAEMTINSAALGRGLQEIVTKQAVFIKAPQALAGKLAPGVSWLKIDLGALVDQSAQGSGGLLGAGGGNPADFLQVLRTVSSSGVRAIGPSSVDGVSTTEYAGTVDLSTAAARLSPTLRSLLASTVTHPTPLPVRIWLDGTGRVRQLQVDEDLHLSISGHSGRAVVKVVVKFSGFGVAVAITQPPDNEVFDATAQVTKLFMAVSGSGVSSG